MFPRSILNSLIAVLAMILSAMAVHAQDNFPTDFAAADVNIGERLFLEPRFSEFFFANCGGDDNAAIPGDPTVSTLRTITGHVAGPFRGQAMNCRQCHLVDEEGYGPYGTNILGNRTYADFTTRSPIPPRDDNRTQTPRNSPTLVDSFIPRKVPLFLHLDGQFASAHDLIIGTLTGRNYGWKPEEFSTAVRHIANIIRNDDATGYLATEARGSRWRLEDTDLATYGNIFANFTNYDGSFITDPRELKMFLISPQYKLDMRFATDEQILDTIASLIEAYLRNLFFSQATNGLDFEGNGTAIFNGSPFDVFLIKNGLPQLPAAGETSAQYARRLLQLVTQLAHPKFVINLIDGKFTTHKQSFHFGQEELDGLKIFLTVTNASLGNRAGNVGNCAACHALPAFTDFLFHNTGAAQEEYDAMHGAGAFQSLYVPDFNTRQTNYDAFLPPTTNHPYATGIFETPPSKDDPGAVDLGLWNVFANPDFPAPQPGLQQIVPQLLGISAPRVEVAKMWGQNLVLSGTNGTPGAMYFVLASTNILAPTSDCQVVATNNFDDLGNFSFSTSMDSAATQTFYKLSLPIPSPAGFLPQTIARFKTPTLRDLGQSDPYLHTGRKNTLEEVIQFYQEFSNKARRNEVRNADPELSGIHLDDAAIEELAAFLRSLNEDYTD
jgi:hypothetical protein